MIPNTNGHAAAVADEPTTRGNDAPDKPMAAPGGRQETPADEGEPDEGAGPEGDAPEGDAPEGDEGGERRPAPKTGGDPLRRKLTQQAEVIAGYEDLLGRIRSNPELWKQVRDTVNQAPGSGVQDTTFSDEDLVELAAQSGFTPDRTGPQLAKFSRGLADRIEARLLRKLEPFLNEAVGTSQEAKRLTGLRRAGVDPTDVDTDEFEDFLREYRVENPDMKYVERGDPSAFWRRVGQAWREAQGDAGRRAQEEELDTRRRAASSLERRGSPGGPTRKAAKPRVKIARGPDRALSILSALNRGYTQDDLDLE